MKQPDGVYWGEEGYLQLLRDIQAYGHHKENRTGISTQSLFAPQLRFDLEQGFPILTTKKMHLKSIIYELIWFLQGRTDNTWLNEHGVTIWDEWSAPEETAKFGRPEGQLGPIYGHQWRNYGASLKPNSTWEYESNGLDQIAMAVDQIKNNPSSRRIIVNAWNPMEVEQVALPPCHTMFQFLVRGNKLDCHLTQRSADSFLGVPFNFSSYALLTAIIAKICGLKPGNFVQTMIDCHIYENHYQFIEQQLGRKVLGFPILVFTKDLQRIEDFDEGCVEVKDYKPHPNFKNVPVAK